MTAYIVMDTLCRLMLPELPQIVAPELLARKGATIAGKYAVSELPRLCAILHNDAGYVTFRLDFALDQDKKHCLITGKVEAALNTDCQRCLNMMELRICGPVALGIIKSQSEADSLPEGYEPLVVDVNTITLSTLIEDELILAMPISAMHDTDKCAATTVLNEINATARNNPFSTLKKPNCKTSNT